MKMVNHGYTKTAIKSDIAPELKLTLKSKDNLHCVTLELGCQTRHVLFEDIVAANRFMRSLRTYTKVKMS